MSSEIISIALEIEPIWMRQPGESSRWYDRLQRYLMAGSQRSLVGVYRVEQEEARLKRASDSLNQPQKPIRWASQTWKEAFVKYRWQERAEAWDRYQADLAREKWQQRHDQLREEFWEAHEQLLKRHQAMMKFPLERQEIIKDHQGRPVRVIVTPADWKGRDAVLYARAAAEMGLLAVGDINGAYNLLTQAGYKVQLSDDAEDLFSSKDEELPYFDR